MANQKDNWCWATRAIRCLNLTGDWITRPQGKMPGKRAFPG